jgi:hypothetical protein
MCRTATIAVHQADVAQAAVAHIHRITMQIEVIEPQTEMELSPEGAERA